MYNEERIKCEDIRKADEQIRREEWEIQKYDTKAIQ